MLITLPALYALLNTAGFIVPFVVAVPYKQGLLW